MSPNILNMWWGILLFPCARAISICQHLRNPKEADRRNRNRSPMGTSRRTWESWSGLAVGFRRGRGNLGGGEDDFLPPLRRYNAKWMQDNHG